MPELGSSTVTEDQGGPAPDAPSGSLHPDPVSQRGAGADQNEG
jgi:hypothetical protein